MFDHFVLFADWQREAGMTRHIMATRHSSATSRLQRIRDAANSTLHLSIYEKLSADILPMARDTLRSLDVVYPCAFHPAFAEEFKEVQKEGCLSLCMASLVPGKLDERCYKFGMEAVHLIGSIRIRHNRPSPILSIARGHMETIQHLPRI